MSRRPFQGPLCTPSVYCTAMSVTVKWSVAPPGISGGEPRLPYPSVGGQTSVRFPPTRIPLTPWSQPLITSPASIVNVNLEAELQIGKPAPRESDGEQQN